MHLILRLLKEGLVVAAAMASLAVDTALVRMVGSVVAPEERVEELVEDSGLDSGSDMVDSVVDRCLLAETVVLAVLRLAQVGSGRM